MSAAAAPASMLCIAEPVERCVFSIALPQRRRSASLRPLARQLRAGLRARLRRASSLAACQALPIAVERALLRAPAHLLQAKAANGLDLVGRGQLEARQRERMRPPPQIEVHEHSDTQAHRRRSWPTFHPSLRRPLRCGALRVHRQHGAPNLNRRRAGMAPSTEAGLQASVTKLRRPRPTAAPRCPRSAIDAGRQHDRRRGALHAVERTDAIDQTVELADRRRRHDGDQVERAAHRVQRAQLGDAPQRRFDGRATCVVPA